MTRQPLRLIGVFALLVPGDVSAQTAAPSAGLPVKVLTGQVGPVPDRNAAQLVPENKRPFPGLSAPRSPAPVPQLVRVVGSPIGNARPDPASLPKPKGAK